MVMVMMILMVMVMVMVMVMIQGTERTVAIEKEKAVIIPVRRNVPALMTL